MAYMSKKGKDCKDESDTTTTTKNELNDNKPIIYSRYFLILFIVFPIWFHLISSNFKEAKNVFVSYFQCPPPKICKICPDPIQCKPVECISKPNGKLGANGQIPDPQYISKQVKLEEERKNPDDE